MGTCTDAKEPVPNEKFLKTYLTILFIKKVSVFNVFSIKTFYKISISNGVIYWREGEDQFPIFTMLLSKELIRK